MSRSIHILFFLAGAWLAGSCGDNQEAPEVPEAAGPCLEQSTDLPRPPTGALSCDMLPPDFKPPT